MADVIHILKRQIFRVTTILPPTGEGIGGGNRLRYLHICQCPRSYKLKYLYYDFVFGEVNLTALDDWFQSMVRLGQADIPMEIEGRIMTPRQYYDSRRSPVL